MSTTNTTTLVGNLVEDMTLRFTTAEKPVANGRIAVNERINVNGEWKDRTTYMNIVQFGPAAENLAASTSKGTRVMVHGRIVIRDYDDAEGKKQYRTEVVVDEAAISTRWAVCKDVEKVRTSATVGAGDVPPEEEPF